MVVGGIPILYGKLDKAFRYLGASTTPWKSLIKGIELDSIRDLIDRVKALLIKPMQKLTLLRTYVLPRFTYALMMCPPPKETLRNINSTIRSGVTRILHLHETINSAFLYTPREQGGLDLLETYPMVYLAALRNATKAAQSDDTIVRSTMLNERSHKTYGTYAAALRLSWPATSEQIKEGKRQIKQGYKKKWSQLIAQRQGMDDFAQPLSNAWLSRSDLLRSSRLIDAIKLRTNTYPTRMTLKRAHENVNLICRACGEAGETLGHILGQCITTKAKRFKRHNEIVDLLKDRLVETNRVMVEHTIKLNGEKLKPDLVISNEERVIVIDVTVRYENKSFLAEAAEEKVDKYIKVSMKLEGNLNFREAKVVPIVVDSRETLSAATIDELK
ncbi:r2 protein [Lasius niger]|uniref:R2 protein n=1 Tax=Lasius niger TaxID=67767 RepID=A0A0J7NKW5_LASNI|nr:r2 protein [Lasius niger]